MNYLRKSLLPVAALAASVLMISMAGPRVVRAAAAALVQIVNTTANAVPAVHAPAANQIYQNSCGKHYDAAVMAQCQLPAVAAGQTLFLETVSMSSFSGTGSNVVRAVLNYSDGLPAVYVPMVQQGTFGNFSGAVAGRMVVKAGLAPVCEVDLDNAPPSGTPNMTCVVHGYLAPVQ